MAEALKTADAKALEAGISSKGVFMLHTSKGPVEVTKEHFTLLEKASKPNSVPFRAGIAYIDPQIDRELQAEALIREFERHIQMLRKEM